MGSFETVMAMNASMEASRAANAATAAQAAAEERLEGTARFVSLPVAKFEYRKIGSYFFGLFDKTEEHMLGTDYVVGLKSTDVASLQSMTDARGKNYTRVLLEERANVEDQDENEFKAIPVPLPMDQVIAILNGTGIYKV